MVIWLEIRVKLTALSRLAEQLSEIIKPGDKHYVEKPDGTKTYICRFD
jgi:hypothetical protein